jgi:hypothetical protein
VIIDIGVLLAGCKVGEARGSRELQVVEKETTKQQQLLHSSYSNGRSKLSSVSARAQREKWQRP